MVQALSSEIEVNHQFLDEQFTEFYNIHHQIVLLYTLGKVGDLRDAEEIAAATFMVTYEKLYITENI